MSFWIIFVTAAAAALSSVTNLLLPKAVDAAQDPEPPMELLGKEVGIVEQIVTTTFKPLTVFVLKETNLGEVKQFHAEAVRFTQQKDQQNDAEEIIVGAPVSVQDSALRESTFHFTFFIAGEDSAFAATEIKKWSEEDLKNSSVSLAQLSLGISELDEELKKKRVQSIDSQGKLAELRNKAYEIAQVNDIIKLKLELEHLGREKDRLATEAERLKALIEIGREQEDPQGVDEYRQQLALHLKEAAQVTALADRLNRRKREAALQNFKTKLKLVKEMDATNPQTLAQEILRLRKKRRELENRLGITSPDTFTDEF